MTSRDDFEARRPGMGVVGRGRLGTALAACLREAGYRVDGPAGRGEVPAGEAILLCVPDAEIPAAAAAVAGAAPLVGHTSGATPLSALAPAERAGAAVFGLHPLQTVTKEDAGRGNGVGRAGGLFAGAGCAIAGSTRRAVATAEAIARSLGMTPFEIDDAGRAAYHAAASIASNFLVTLEAAAERMAGAAGIEEARELLAPLVRSTVENWAKLGPAKALTGPLVRGDERTVARQRAAVAERTPELLPMWDALADATRDLAAVPT
jgi:predicted short-subunit dehydrogenase-like oxidoreductase (DUF2520 family)